MRNTTNRDSADAAQLSTVTEKVLFYRYEESQSIADLERLTHSLSLSIKMWWSTISKAALRFNSTITEQQS